MMRTEILETHRLFLRPFEREDAPFAISIWNDPEMGEYLPDEAMEEVSPEYLKMIEDCAEDDTCYYMISEDKCTHERIGTCSFIISEDGNAMDIAYCVQKQFWRNGYATEMAKGMVDYAKSCGMDKVTVRVNKTNDGSNRVVKKLGFEVVGEYSYKKRGTDLTFEDFCYELKLAK